MIFASELITKVLQAVSQQLIVQENGGDKLTCCY